MSLVGIFAGAVRAVKDGPWRAAADVAPSLFLASAVLLNHDDTTRNLALAAVALRLASAAAAYVGEASEGSSKDAASKAAVATLALGGLEGVFASAASPSYVEREKEADSKAPRLSLGTLSSYWFSGGDGLVMTMELKARPGHTRRLASLLRT
mmetsp:Transcript_1698/g.5775  ORF Transcript_1698/g.5775 Transcript_1698/m.5775 type:complete len:153 (-) Transcript_1698:496-954(-)